MTDKINAKSAHQEGAKNHASETSGLTGLFDEMQALMTLMPGAAFVPATELSSQEELEEMFDNMPV
jgi:hypothetical protein